MLPPGSSANPSILLRSASPTTHFEFTFDMGAQLYCDFNVDYSLPQPLLRDSVIKVVGLPRVCSLTRNNNMVIKVL